MVRLETWRFETGRGCAGKKWEALGCRRSAPPVVQTRPGPDRGRKSEVRCSESQFWGGWVQQPLGNPLFSKPCVGQKMGPEACISSRRGRFWTHFLCGKHTELFKGEEAKAQKCNVSQSVGLGVVQGHQITESYSQKGGWSRSLP